ncbi:hypothetical protein HMPREF1986_02057 [Oribacterium sp. oral taxon 078 str. F0263]|nr:hypothetical protein HMPREF1986_02057 [Oribacterium sp. oral taxon 078 str. F0263]
MRGNGNSAGIFVIADFDEGRGDIFRGPRDRETGGIWRERI